MNGTARYLVRHSLWRTLAGVVSGVLQVTGLTLLGLVGAVIYMFERWPTLALLLLLAWWLWRQIVRHRPRPVPVSPLEALKLAHLHARVEHLRARTAVLRGGRVSDVAAAEPDFQAGKISLEDLQEAYAHDVRRGAA